MTILAFSGFWQLIVIALFIFALLLPLIALIDIVRSEFTGNNKLVWVLVVLFFPYLGAILYFLLGGGQKVRR
jgi:hypothetical protein